MATCMIIDDEPLSRDVLRRYINEVKDLTMVAECPDAFEATHQLNQNLTDIISLISTCRDYRGFPLPAHSQALP